MADNPRDKFQQMRGKPPEEAKFFWSGGPVEVGERSWFQSRFSGVTGFETDEGVVLVDSGLEVLSPHLAESLRSQTDKPIHTAIFTQGHVDHAFGLQAFLVPGQTRPRVIAHEDMPARFARYTLTSAHNAALNARQFGGAVQDVDTGAYDNFKAPAITPDTLYRDRMDIIVGGVTFEIHHCRGETDDHTWVFCPDREVLCPGDLFIWGVPNAGNPQKVQRFALDWAHGLRAMAACRPCSLAPGHGGPVVNEPEKLQDMLLETAEFLETIHNRTVEALNNGSPPHVDIVHDVELPVSKSPWLQPVYDDTEFIVRNIVRLYGGWWTGRPSELKPAPRSDLAREIATLVGGVETLAARAQALAKAGDLRLACHLADYALEAAPENEAVQSLVADVYDKRATSETALMSINIFNSASAYAREGRAFR
ncbi:MAG: alkyl sulfatase dimerization domain-containing protein [Parvularculales bacterium]